jgi:zinc transporter, ZIP family
LISALLFGIAAPSALVIGAALASLADTLMPPAYELGGSLVAFATAVGFLLSFILAV